MERKEACRYIHVENRSFSDRNSLSAKSELSINGDKIIKLPMNQKEAIREHIFGIDRMVCSVPVYDISTGEVMVDIDKIKRKLKSFSFIQSEFKNDIIGNLNDQSDYFLDDDYDIDLEEVKHYEKLVGTLNKLPVKIILKNDILMLDLTLSNILHGNNSNPTEISEIEKLCDIVSGCLGIDILNAYLNQVEFAFGIKTNQSIPNLVDSLGNLGCGDKHSSPNGTRWTGIGHSSSIQVYSTNLKNKLKASKGLSTRSTELKELEELGYDMVRIENRRRYGFRRDVLCNLPFVSNLKDPNFILEELYLFSVLFGKVIKNQSKISIQALEHVDIDDMVLKIQKPGDCRKILFAIGWAYAQDILRNNLTNISMNYKNRLSKLFDQCQSYMDDMISNHSIPQHFHDKGMEVIRHYVQLFEGVITNQGSFPDKGPSDCKLPLF